MASKKQVQVAKQTDRSALPVAARIVVVTAALAWLLTTLLPSSLLGSAGGDGGRVVVVPDVYAAAILPPDLSALVARVATNDDDVRAQFCATQSPTEVAEVLEHLSTALFDINQAFEDEDPDLYAAKSDVAKLVATVEGLVTCITGGSMLSAPVKASTEPSLPLWGVATATAFAQGVALADYYRILERDERHSGSIVDAMDTLWRISVSPSAIDFNGAEAAMTAAATAAKEDAADTATRVHSMFKLFATSSMMSAELALRRRTSMLEELIAIHSTLAPLRLHYIAAVLFDLHGATLGTGGQSRFAVVADLIDREKQAISDGKRRGADVGNDALLDVLKLHAALMAAESAAKGTATQYKGTTSSSSLAELVALGFKAYQRIRSLGAGMEDGGSNACESFLMQPWTANTENGRKDDVAVWSAVVGRPKLLRQESRSALLSAASAAIAQHVGEAAKAALVDCLF